MEWLRDLPWPVFWFGWGIVALVGGASLTAVRWARRNVDAISAQTPVDVSGLSAGYRLAWGRTAGPELTAPLTGRPCVWWRVQVWESVRERPGGPVVPSERTRWVWRERVSAESDRPMLFGDDRGLAAVWPRSATAVIPSGWSDWRGQSFPPEDTEPVLRRGGAPGGGIRTDLQGTAGPRFRYVEQIIERDAPVFALGEATATDRALSDEEAGDGDAAWGAFDGGGAPEPGLPGLRPARPSVIAADLARSDWTIGAAPGRPFLVSTEHPGSVAAEQALGAKGGLIMGGLFAVLALGLAWVRLAS